MTLRPKTKIQVLGKILPRNPGWKNIFHCHFEIYSNIPCVAYYSGVCAAVVAAETWHLTLTHPLPAVQLLQAAVLSSDGR